MGLVYNRAKPNPQLKNPRFGDKKWGKTEQGEGKEGGQAQKNQKANLRAGRDT